jgi:hypothetical protein
MARPARVLRAGRLRSKKQVIRCVNWKPSVGLKTGTYGGTIRNEIKRNESSRNDRTGISFCFAGRYASSAGNLSISGCSDDWPRSTPSVPLPPPTWAGRIHDMALAISHRYRASEHAPLPKIWCKPMSTKAPCEIFFRRAEANLTARNKAFLENCLEAILD